MDDYDIDTADWRTITQSELNNIDECCEKISGELGFPLIVKPAKSGTSAGTSKADDLEQFIAAVENREIPIEVEVDDDDEDETDEHPISTSKELPSETPENADNTQNDNKDTDDEIVFHDVPKDDE